MPDRPLTPTQKIELRRLFQLLSDAASSAAEALGADSAMPVGLPLRRFETIDERVADIHRRIRAMLDQGRA